MSSWHDGEAGLRAATELSMLQNSHEYAHFQSRDGCRGGLMMSTRREDVNDTEQYKLDFSPSSYQTEDPHPPEWSIDDTECDCS